MIYYLEKKRYRTNTTKQEERKVSWERNTWGYTDTAAGMNDHFKRFTTILDTTKYPGYEPVHQQLQSTKDFTFCPIRSQL